MSNLCVCFHELKLFLPYASHGRPASLGLHVGFRLKAQISQPVIGGRFKHNLYAGFAGGDKWFQFELLFRLHGFTRFFRRLVSNEKPAPINSFVLLSIFFTPLSSPFLEFSRLKSLLAG